MGEKGASFEVHDPERATNHGNLVTENATQDEPPTDGGRDAWLVLTSSFVLGAIVWGFPYSFGVFQEYYLRQEAFSGAPEAVAAIGTTATGVMHLTAPALYIIVQRYRRQRMFICITGFIVVLAGLVGASFATTVLQLIMTQGVVYALGGTMLYFPVFNYIDEWFIKRRGFAYGALVAGDGAGGVVIPFVMEWALSSWGFRTALRIWVIVCLLFVTPCLAFLKDYPISQDEEHKARTFDFRFLKTKVFWILQVGNIVQSLGYYMPSYYLPSFAVACGWSSLTGTIAVALCNAAIVFGALTVGWLCDRYHVTVPLLICTTGAVLSAFVLWGFAVYQPVMYIFAIMYGFFAGAFPSTWAGCSHPIRRVYPVETGMILVLFTTGKGVGSIISGPLGGLLASSDNWKGHLGYSYGSGFGYLIVFTGVTATFGSLGWIGKKIGWVS